MNRELLPEFLKIAYRQHGRIHKHTETEEVECWCWTDKRYEISNKQYDEDCGYVKGWIQANGWKIEQPDAVGLFKGYLGISKTFFTITYDKSKDKISISGFETGYRYRHSGGRLYSYRRNTPLLCFSKHIYAFVRRPVKTRSKWYPRIYNGIYYQPWMNEYLCHRLRCAETVPDLWVHWKYMVDASSRTEAFWLKTGLLVDQVLKLLGLNIEYNYLIQCGGKKVRELCLILNYRISEKVLGNNPIHTTQSFLREDIKPLK